MKADDSEVCNEQQPDASACLSCQEQGECVFRLVRVCDISFCKWRMSGAVSACFSNRFPLSFNTEKSVCVAVIVSLKLKQFFFFVKHVFSRAFSGLFFCVRELIENNCGFGVVSESKD